MSIFNLKQLIVIILIFLLIVLLLTRIFLVNQIRLFYNQLYDLDFDQKQLMLEFEYLQSHARYINASELQKRAVEHLHMIYPKSDD